MKKVTALLLTFVFLFSFAACKKDEVQTAIATDTCDNTVSTAFETVSVYSETTSETASKYSELQTKSSKKTTVIRTTATDIKATITEVISDVFTSTERKTKPSTTRRNYFPSKVSTTKNKTEITTEKITESSTAGTTKKSSGGIGGPTVPKTAVKNNCTVSINCSEILKDISSLKKGKEAFVPSDGTILETITVEFEPGETVFDILKRICAEYSCSDNCRYCQNSGIQLEYGFTPGYDNYYIEGIHQIYEKDCGSKSGWMYMVNGVFPNYGCSDYTVKNGDMIEWVYTLNLGDDVGAEL